MEDLVFVTKETPESSNILSVGYNKEKEVMRIVFKGGSAYRYYGVDEELFVSATSSLSVGKFVHAHVKGKFESVKEV